MPSESSVGERGYTPSSGHRPLVVLSPKTPEKAAGLRTDPPVSEPTAKAHIPAATATAEPLDEPPGTRCTTMSQGLRGVPRTRLVPAPPRANSTVLVLPRRRSRRA